ncbi:3'-5' RNA exonuclease complex component, partial [Cryomyces antarcticus]
PQLFEVEHFEQLLEEHKERAGRLAETFRLEADARNDDRHSKPDYHPSKPGGLTSPVSKRVEQDLSSLARRRSYGKLSAYPRRQYHSSGAVSKVLLQFHSDNPTAPLPPVTNIDSSPKLESSPTRERLKLWQEQFGERGMDLLRPDSVDDFSDTYNHLTRLGDPDDMRAPEDEEDADTQALAEMTHNRYPEPEDIDIGRRFLRRGDLVELGFNQAEREPVLAVFVRNFETQSQFYTIQGKWVHRKQKEVQYNLPGFMDPAMLDSILPYLPRAEVTLEMLDQARMFDFSVPRGTGSAIVERMSEFYRESESAYRKHASILDNAHRILAHPTDLRFGSLERIAQKLIGQQYTDTEISQPAVYAVRKALIHAGFAFGLDFRSHRTTGVFQIRSKAQVQMVDGVRHWLREYQDDLALSANYPKGIPESQKKEGTRVVERFVATAKALIAQSRSTRDVTIHGSVGPSKVRIPITPTQNSTRQITSRKFTSTDAQLIRFLEAWSTSTIFKRHPRIEALGPVLLRAVGAYDDHPLLGQDTAFVFLQEIGVLLPYENRVRYDEHLLLPSSQHSKPLEQLMTSLLEMENHGAKFNDTMKHLRKDWGDLAVFCIDGASAMEIDDGISVEPITNENGAEEEAWIHVHVANPSAFFTREHLLAKMAGHLTESIYMPERPFTMLPRWTTEKHFSLAPDRPVLTFSARVNMEGQVKEKTITPGIIHNVVSLTPADVSQSLGMKQSETADVELIVGGRLPPKQHVKGHNVTESQRQALVLLQRIATGRHRQRRQAGGLFINQSFPEMTVYEGWKRPGLGWSRPHRDQAHFVEGDPVIHLQAKSYQSWFTAGDEGNDLLVRESMLLACAIGAEWCKERNIPVIYRGTIRNPELPDPDVYNIEVVQPSVDAYGQPPMHIGLRYMQLLGQTMVSTTPTKHRFLGLPQYSKVTSPLRRYGDIIMHWQIEAALREEALTGESLVNSTREDYLPFSRIEVDKIINRLQPRERLISRASRNAETFWLAQLLFRAYYFKEAALPESFKVLVYSTPVGRFHFVGTILKEYSIDVDMTRPDLLGFTEEARVGDTWEVKIDHISAYVRRVLVTPLRLIERADN